MLPGMYGLFQTSNSLPFGVHPIQTFSASTTDDFVDIALNSSVRENDWFFTNGHFTDESLSVGSLVDSTLFYFATINDKSTGFARARRINNYDLEKGYITIGLTYNAADWFNISTFILRPYKPITTLGYGNWGHTYTSGNPAARTITSSGQPLPVLVWGVGSNTASGITVSPFTFTPAPDFITNNVGMGQYGYKIYNDITPVNHTIDIDDEGGGNNILYGGYVTFNFINTGFSAGCELKYLTGPWSFTVPNYANSFKITILGAGGGGGADVTNSGSAGGSTTCTQLSWIAGGGGGGLPNTGAGGAGGTNSGTADISNNGTAGQAGSTNAGGLGGLGGIWDFGFGGSGSSTGGGGGGSGGHMKKTYSFGGISPGTVLSGTVGIGGAGAPAGGAAGYNGSNGVVVLEWN